MATFSALKSVGTKFLPIFSNKLSRKLITRMNFLYQTEFELLVICISLIVRSFKGIGHICESGSSP